MSRCNPTVHPGLSIPELIKIVKHSFRERDFDDVQNILMDREAKLKLEIENLQTDYNSAKDEARLLDKNLNLAELQKLSLEEKLQMSRTKCTVLKDTVAKLGQEIEDLKREKEELSRQNVEATDTLDELIRKKIDSDREVESYKIKIPILESRIMKVEGAFANMLNVKVEDLAPLANYIDKSDAASKGGKIDIDSGDRNSNRSSTKEDGANAALTSPGAPTGGSPRVEPQVSGDTRTRNLIVICNLEDKINSNDAAHVSDSPLSARKRKRRVFISDNEDDLPTDERENQDPESTHHRSTPPDGILQSTLPSGPDSKTHDRITDLDDDSSSCSNSHMDNLLAAIEETKVLDKT